MKTFALLLLLLVAPFTTAVAADCTPATPAEIERIRTAMEGALLDAQSARYKDVCMKKAKRETNGKIAFCGKVNAKNKFGAYAGYRLFSYVEGAEPDFFTTADTSKGDDARFFYCLACLGTADFCLKQKWIHNPKLLH